MRGFMVVLLPVELDHLMSAAGIEAVGLLEQEAGQQRDDQRGAQRVEGVAEARM
jgi:hypothetical protein